MRHDNKDFKTSGGRQAVFEGFRLDFHAHELFRDGERIALPQQASRLLEMLVARPRELVTREEIKAWIWQDRHVDFEAGINTAIRKIRRALDDDAANPKIIETVPKRGYRFLIEPEFASNESVEPVVNPRRRYLRPLGAAAFLAALAVAVITLLPLRKAPGAPPVGDNATEINSPGYESFLFGSHAMKQGAYARAENHFEKAISLDENYASAYVGLAHAKVFNRGRRFSNVADAQKFLDKALEINPDHAAARHLNARLALYYWRDHARARRELLRSLDLAPDDPDVLTTAAYFYTIIGDSEAALAAIARAHKISPLSPALNADYGWVHYKARNWDDAERLCKTSAEMNPRSSFALECVIHINHSQGDFAEAADYGMRLMALRGASNDEIRALREISDAGERERAFWTWLEKWIDRSGRPSQFAKRAIALSMLGRLDEAAASLDQAFEQNGQPFLSFVAIDPRLDELKAHREFERFAELSRIAVPIPGE